MVVLAAVFEIVVVVGYQHRRHALLREHRRECAVERLEGAPSAVSTLKSAGKHLATGGDTGSRPGEVPVKRTAGVAETVQGGHIDGAAVSTQKMPVEAI
jgi:hypothetical protein